MTHHTYTRSKPRTTQQTTQALRWTVATVIVAAAAAALTAGCQEDGFLEPHGALPELLVERESQPLAFGHPEQDCGRCHSRHVAEWRISNHAYAAKDPVFHAMVKAGQEQTKGKLGQFCVQCHSPTGMVTGQTPVVYDQDSETFKQPLDNLDPVAQAGVSCDVCHSITEVIEPVNARAVMTPNGTRRGTIKDPVPTEAHGSEYSELHSRSDLCGMCHAVTNPRGALIEETFPEWEASNAAKEGKTCQSCHMPEYTGRAAPNGPLRTLHQHFFVGVDVSLLPEEEFPGYQKMRRLTAELLRSSASVRVLPRPEDQALFVAITNLAGHALPSGATAERQLWLELIVKDDQGQIVFESGTLDDLGDLRDGIAHHSSLPGSDPQLAYHGQLLIQIPGLDDVRTEGERTRMLLEAEAACRPMGLGGVEPASGIKAVDLPWQANWQCNSMIPADGTAHHTYDLSQLPAGHYTASLRLLFRTFPPYFLRHLEEVGDLDPDVKTRLPTVTLHEEDFAFTLP